MSAVIFDFGALLLPGTAYGVKITLETPNAVNEVVIQNAATIETYPPLPEFSVRVIGSNQVVFIWTNSKYIKTKNVEIQLVKIKC